ncbi:MAG: hypothetical protein LBD02_10670 [Christensenellaceae bacterium]|jgi:transcriptional regulator with XRE-family HTH domain|nr:hypothetical protein [Christensenellaceae bacterium]
MAKLKTARELGEEYKALRQQKGFTQAGIMHFLRRGKKTIVEMENGKLEIGKALRLLRELEEAANYLPDKAVRRGFHHEKKKANKPKIKATLPLDPGHCCELPNEWTTRKMTPQEIEEFDRRRDQRRNEKFWRGEMKEG